MTKMFGNMTSTGLEAASDRLGGGSTLDTNLYAGTVKLAYAGKSAGGANSLTLIMDLNGQEYRETFYVTNKNGENFYQDKNDPKKKQPLPGFTSIDDLCLLTTGYPLAEQSFEDKVVKIYDFEAKKEIPTNVPVMVDVLGKPIAAAIIRQTVDKQKKDNDGTYRNTGETRDENIVDKFFHAESARTVNEIKEGIETGVFAGKWVEKNKGVTRNKSKGSEGTAGVPGSKSTAAGGSTPKKSLFA